MPTLRVPGRALAARGRSRAALRAGLFHDGLLGLAGLLLVIVGTVALSAQSPATPSPPAADSGAAGDASRGERIYLEGVLSGGGSIPAVVEGDVEIEGGQIYCESCHQRSGLGTSEAGALVPRVTRRTLYEPRSWRRADLLRKLYQEQQPKAYWSRVRDPLTRPAYTDETLAAAIRDGVDSSGRKLDPMMPRYALAETDMADLIAYLKTLESAPDPGVDEERIHFATVVTPDSRPSETSAVLEVLNAFVERKNRWVVNENLRRGHSPHYKDLYLSSFREWSLHVWELAGPADTWPQQLDAYYGEQPVFAVLGGVGPGSWRPMHDFCARAEVPCLFPITDLPVADSEDLWSVYFSRGMTLEGEVVARHLGGVEPAAGSEGIENAGPTGGLVQVVGADERATVAAAATATALEGRMAVVESTADELSARQAGAATAWALWMTADEVGRLAETLDPDRLPERIYLSATLVGDDPATIPEMMRDRARWVSPWALAGERVGELRRIRAWMMSRGLESSHERLRLQTYFTLSLIDHVMMHLVDNFSRDYFLEEVEHEAEQEINQAAYPHLSLGPGQRFASKGAYVMLIGDDSEGGLAAQGEWIVP